MGENRWLAKGSDVHRGRAYDERFAAKAAEGAYLHGEADLIERFDCDAVLDAGCGTGRIAIELARRGSDVVGVDLDPAMLAAAREKAPDIEWIQADLAELRLDAEFDVVVAAGNVMIFLTPGTEAEVTARLADHVVEGGHLICGFSLADDHLSLDDHLSHCGAAGLDLVQTLATWEGEDYAGGDYVVTIHRRPDATAQI